MCVHVCACVCMCVHVCVCVCVCSRCLVSVRQSVIVFVSTVRRLRDNQIDDEGAEMFADAMKINTTLKGLAYVLLPLVVWHVTVTSHWHLRC